MMTITLDNDQKIINVPQSWSEIRLGDYEKWFDTEPKTRLDEIRLIAEICGVDAAILLDNPTQLFDIVAESVGFIFGENTCQPSNKIEIEGQTYVVAFTDELSLAEWIDVESVFENAVRSRLSEILSILCRPVGEVYDSKRSESRRQMFAALSMDKAMPLLTIFLHRNELSETISNLCSQVEDQASLYLLHTRDFVENGAGIKSLPIWQRIKFYFLMKYLKRQLSKFSDSFSTKSTKITQKTNKISFRSKSVDKNKAS